MHPESDGVARTRRVDRRRRRITATGPRQYEWHVRERLTDAPAVHSPPRRPAAIWTDRVPRCAAVDGKRTADDSRGFLRPRAGIDSVRSTDDAAGGNAPLPADH